MLYSQLMKMMNYEIEYTYMQGRTNIDKLLGGYSFILAREAFL